MNPSNAGGSRKAPSSAERELLALTDEALGRLLYGRLLAREESLASFRRGFGIPDFAEVLGLLATPAAVPRDRLSPLSAAAVLLCESQAYREAGAVWRAAMLLGSRAPQEFIDSSSTGVRARKRGRPKAQPGFQQFLRSMEARLARTSAERRTADRRARVEQLAAEMRAKTPGITKASIAKECVKRLRITSSQAIEALKPPRKSRARG